MTNQPSAEALLRECGTLIERCAAREYNPFEPDNQTRLYTDLVALAQRLATFHASNPATAPVAGEGDSRLWDAIEGD